MMMMIVVVVMITMIIELSQIFHSSPIWQGLLYGHRNHDMEKVDGIPQIRATKVELKHRQWNSST